MGLGQLLVSATQAPAKLYTNANEYEKTDGIFIAAAAVDPAIGLYIGASITLPGEMSATTITASNIVALIKKLAKAGSAYFFGKESFKATKPKQVPGAETQTFGYAAGPRLTRRVPEHFIATYTKWYGNEAFFNQFLDNKLFDFFFFTNNSVHQVLSNEDISYPAEDLGYPMEGNPGEGITGSFGVMCVRDGFQTAETGIAKNDLTEKDVVLTIDAPTTGGDAMTAGTCALPGVKKYTKAEADDSTLTFALTPVNDCVDWAVYIAGGLALPAGYGTFDSVTKVLTLPSTMTTGTYTYYVTATNRTGVRGQMEIQITVA